MKQQYNTIIIGSGIIGLCIADAIKKSNPAKSILVIDKESREAYHASSRNSGVLHAGFYYTADSLKAKLTVKGNGAWQKYCQQKNLPINRCGKLVVAQNELEHAQLFELEKRGRANGSNIRLIDAKEAQAIEPNVKTFQHALYSPDTASVNPTLICATLKNDLLTQGVDFLFNAKYLSRKGQVIQTNQGEVEGQKIINCAGLYADKVAADFGFGLRYTIIPFKGLYLKYTKNKTDIQTNIYPVPNLKNPFLGVHFTKTVDGTIKIGPTAIPALWRENYHLHSNFNLKEFLAIGAHESKLLLTNAFGFRNLAFEEMRKYNRSYFIKLAQNMVNAIDPKGFTEYTPPGIRAQLLDKKTSLLVQDFVVEGDQKSIHILNAVSPAFTCAIPFAEYVIEKFKCV